MKNKQGITIAALIIAIIGLSIGFAAFSNTLQISSSASVNPSDENFIVQFSKYQDSDATGELNPITPTLATSQYGTNGLIPDSNKKKLQDLKATFTAPGQSVTYELYVRNTGQYVAYLKDLVFANAENATGGETYKHCYAAVKDSNNQDIPAAQQATPSLVSTACQGISISVSIGTATNITPDSASKSLGNQALSTNGGNVAASVTITYAAGSAYVDGPMEVEFGTISFTATSNQGSSQEQGGNGQQGGQEEPQQTVDALIPTETEIGQADIIDLGFYSFIGEFGESNVSLLYFESTINLETEDGLYVWYSDSTSAAAVSSEQGTTILPYKWYKDDEGYQLYTGPSPISLSDFNPEDIKSQSYVTRVINSFSNNS